LGYLLELRIESGELFLILFFLKFGNLKTQKKKPLNSHHFAKKEIIQQNFVQKNSGPISCTHYTLPNAKNCKNTKFSNKLKQKSI
jgi:hypothetical protein